MTCPLASKLETLRTNARFLGATSRRVAAAGRDAVQHCVRPPGCHPRLPPEAWNSKDGKRQAVLLVNIGELSRSDNASAAIQQAVETAYCSNVPT